MSTLQIPKKRLIFGKKHWLNHINTTNTLLRMKHCLFLCTFTLAIAICSCAKNKPESLADIHQPDVQTRSIIPDEFDWETTDWMPTPHGQPKIPMPWGGQGSISAFYGLDVVTIVR